MRKVTKSCYVDTNLLIFLQNKHSARYQETRLIFKKLIEKEYDLYISSLIIDEYLYNTYRLLSGNRQNKLKVLKSNLRRILKIPKIKLINPSLEEKKHLQVVNLMAKYNLDSRDAYHLFIMLGNKIKYLATFDSDFDKVFATGIIKSFK